MESNVAGGARAITLPVLAPEWIHLDQDIAPWYAGFDTLGDPQSCSCIWPLGVEALKR
jgi:hypothetical protein